MAWIKKYVYEAEVLKWKVKPDASDLFGGMFKLRMASSNSTDQFKEFLDIEFGEYKVVFFPKSSLGNLSFLDTAGHLLCAALRQYPLLRSCNNLDRIATLVTAYLLCKYRFSPEILSGQGSYKPIIRIDLLVTLQEQDSLCRVADRNDLVELDKLIILGPDEKLVRGAALSECYSSGEEWAEDIELVNEGLVMKHFVDDGGDDLEEMNCPVCLRRFDDKNAAVTPCSHVFHQECIIEWLTRTDSCPMCRSACLVWV